MAERASELAGWLVAWLASERDKLRGAAVYKLVTPIWRPFARGAFEGTGATSASCALKHGLLASTLISTARWPLEFSRPQAKQEDMLSGPLACQRTS